MKIRPIEPSDVSAIADLQAAAFADDELFTWLYPRRQEYPWNYRHDWLLSIRRRIAQSDLKIFVAEVDGDVVGCAVWKRTGEDENAAKWYNDSLHKSECYSAYFSIDCSASETRSTCRDGEVATPG
jgi:predicted N-acetyltransferase YhbS